MNYLESELEKIIYFERYAIDLKLFTSNGFKNERIHHYNNKNLEDVYELYENLGILDNLENFTNKKYIEDSANSHKLRYTNGMLNTPLSRNQEDLDHFLLFQSLNIAYKDKNKSIFQVLIESVIRKKLIEKLGEENGEKLFNLSKFENCYIRDRSMWRGEDKFSSTIDWYLKPEPTDFESLLSIKEFFSNGQSLNVTKENYFTKGIQVYLKENVLLSTQIRIYIN